MIFIDPKGDNPFFSRNGKKENLPNSESTLNKNKNNSLKGNWITGRPGAGKTVRMTMNMFEKSIKEMLEKEKQEEAKKINNPKISTTELFEIASTSRFPENVKKAINHNNFNMEKYLEEFCDN